MTEARQDSAIGEDHVDVAEIARRLPPPEGTEYPYDLVTLDGRTAYLAGQIPKQGGCLAFEGRVGIDMDVEGAAKAARICAEQALAWLNHSCGGLGNLRRILRLTCYVAHGDGFADISTVADGASRFMIEALGHKGRHARSVIGVKSLPRNAPVLLEVTAALRAPL